MMPGLFQPTERDYKLGNAIFARLLPLAILIVGILSIILIGFQQWIIIGVILGLMSASLFLFMVIKRPEIVMILGILVTFTFIGYQAGYIIIIFEFITLFIYGLLCRIYHRIDVNTLLWFGIIIIGLLSAVNWNDKYIGIKALFHLGITPLLIYLIIVNYLSDKQCRAIISKGFPIISCVIVISSLVVFLIKLSSVESFSSIIDISDFRRLEIPNNGSNRLAGLLIFLSVFLYTTKRIWVNTWLKGKLLYILIGLALFISVVTQSRGAVINLIIAGISIGFSAYLSGKKVKVNIVTLVLCAVPILIVSKSFIEKLIFRFQIVSIDYSNIFRLVMWRDALINIKNGMIIGKGPGHVVYSVWGVIHDDPHNVFLRYGVEFGGITIILLAMIFALPVWKFIKVYKQNKSSAVELFVIFVPALLGTLVQSQFDYIINAFSFGALFWAIWALMLRELDMLHTTGRLKIIDSV